VHILFLSVNVYFIPSTPPVELGSLFFTSVLAQVERENCLITRFWNSQRFEVCQTVTFGWRTPVSRKSLFIPSSNTVPAPMAVSWRATKICWRRTWEPAICHPTSSRTSWLTGHPGGPHLRSRYLTLSAAIHWHFKTSVFSARPAVSYCQSVDSPVTPAVTSVHQGSVSSLTNELICDPEIRRVDGSFQPTNHICLRYNTTEDKCSCPMSIVFLY